MELRHLRYFQMVAQELNFRRAAERLFMEPQPLNFQIRQLERELGFRLFSHSDGRTQLTAAGETFSHDVDAILASTEQAVARAGRVARGEAGTLRIAIPSAMANMVVAPAIKSFHATYPDVSFSVRQMTYRDLLEAVQRSQIDVGLGMVPLDDPRFEAKALSRARPVVVVPTTDELAALPVVPWSALNSRETIVLDPEQAPNARKALDAILADHGVEVHESQSVADTESAISFAGYGFGLAIVFAPHGALPERPGVTFVALPADAAEVVLGAIWLRGDENPLRDKFIETLQAAATDVAPVASPVG